MAALSQDILAIPLEQFPDVQSVLTAIGGKILSQAESFVIQASTRFTCCVLFDDIAGASRSPFHCRRNLAHSCRKTRRKCRLHLRQVGSGILAVEDNELCDPRSPVSQLVESPLKQHACPIQRHLQRVRLHWTDFPYAPVSRLLPRHSRRSPRACREWPVQLELCRRVVPVCNVRHISPGKSRTRIRVNGMRNLPCDVVHISPAQNRMQELIREIYHK